MPDTNLLFQEQPVALRPSPSERLDALATIMRYRSGQKIYSQEDPAECWYRVVSGTLRRFALRSDGRRQIVDFLLPGDWFGFAAASETHAFSVEAVTTGAVVACFPRRRLEMLADSDPRISRELRAISSGAISRLQHQILILGRIRAPERVGSFLIEMAVRCACGSSDRVVLPMSRYDIADYLGLSVETVSRAMTDLKRRGAIALGGRRQVRIVDAQALDDGDSAERYRTPAGTAAEVT
jgi:CRP/FNR family nitrogen fixation transcriptional regulator